MAKTKEIKEYTVTKEGIEFNHVRLNKKVVITEEEVRMLARLHCSGTEMSRYFGVKHNTFYNYFRNIIDSEKERTKQKIRAKLIEEALNGNIPALIFSAKSICGLSDQPKPAEDNKQPLPWKEDEL